MTRPSASRASRPAGPRWTPSCERKLADKEGVEIAQGLLVAHVLASRAAGRTSSTRCCGPRPRRSSGSRTSGPPGVADLGPAMVERRGRAGLLELRNPRRLNAEDDDTLGPAETAVDLILLDPDVEVGVMRGGVVEHPSYAGRRIFGAGLNLTHLYHGRISFLFFLTRDLGYVNKIYRGLTGPEHRPDEPEDTTEKLWLAAVETYAIGGACQLLHVMDHVIAERGARLFLPARKEGIIPGASNLRLPRFVGERPRARRSSPAASSRPARRRATCSCDEIGRPGGDGRRPGGPHRGPDQLGPRQRGRQPARDARRPGADRPLPPVHGRVLHASRPTATSARRWCATSRSTGMRAQRSL